MTHLPISFRAGKIVASSVKTKAWPDQPLLGNFWRGFLIVSGMILLLKGLWTLAAIVFSAALVWSLIENALRNWQAIYLRQKTLRCLDLGRGEEALALCSTPNPGTRIWWRFLELFFSLQRWQLASEWLEKLEAGKERDFLLAVTKLGLNRPAEALSLCPARPDGAWLILKAEALFQLQEWNKVLGFMRGSAGRGRGPEQLEIAWLKGGSYFFLSQYKPAVKLLRQVAEQGGDEYKSAGDWLLQALAKIE